MTFQFPVGGGTDRIIDGDEWVTVLEFELPNGGSLPVRAVEALVERLRPWQPAALWNPDRYAIQMHVVADGPDDALQRALGYHRDALASVALARWAGSVRSGRPGGSVESVGSGGRRGLAGPSDVSASGGLAEAVLVRVEVLGAEELERSWREDDPSETAAPDSGQRVVAAAARVLVCQELYQATRQLLATTTPEDVADTVLGFVAAVGGRVQLGATGPLVGVTDVDISAVAGIACHARAETQSVPGLILEQSLPTLLDDATRTLALLQRHASTPKSSPPS